MLAPGLHRVPPADQLQEEIERQPLWMYRWNLGRGLTTPTVHPSDALMHLHETRLKMMEPAVREALAAAGPDARVIDLACNEGWFAHRMLDWGAGSVLGIDIREVNVRRAELIREHYGIDQDRLSFRRSDVFDLDPDELGSFDVVLLLGLIYHLEDPMGAIRLARRLCRRVCVIESQLNRHMVPLQWGAGPRVHESPMAFAVNVETDAETNPVASTSGIMSLIPNRAALVEMPSIAGFAEVERCEAPADAEGQYIIGDRGQVLAWSEGR